MSIHKVMGADLNKLITCVTGENCKPWMAEQVTVLMTRTHTLAGTIFVGNKEETKRILTETLFKPCRFREYLSRVIHLLADGCGAQGGADGNFGGFDLTHLPWKPLDFELPSDKSGVVYLLVSMKTRTDNYIGETEDLARRLRSHNSGHGSQGSTSVNLRPWSVVAFVMGFDGKRWPRRHFERQWKELRDKYGGDGCTVGKIVELGEYLANQKNREFGLNLRFVHCMEQSVVDMMDVDIDDGVGSTGPEHTTADV